MNAKNSLKAVKRKTKGKGSSRKLRKEGLIPAVVYGGDTSMSLTIDPVELVNLLKELGGDNAIIPLSVKGARGGSKNVILKEMQSNPVSDELLHVDLLEIAMDRAITMEVPITLQGEPEPVKDGDAIVEQILDSVEVLCLPSDIPQELVLDISGMGMNEVLTVGDLTLPEGVEVRREEDTPVVTVGAVKVVEEVEEEEEAEEVEEGAEEAAEEGAEEAEAEAAEEEKE